MTVVLYRWRMVQSMYNSRIFKEYSKTLAKRSGHAQKLVAHDSPTPLLSPVQFKKQPIFGPHPTLQTYKLSEPSVTCRTSSGARHRVPWNNYRWPIPWRCWAPICRCSPRPPGAGHRPRPGRRSPAPRRGAPRGRAARFDTSNSAPCRSATGAHICSRTSGKVWRTLVG